MCGKPCRFREPDNRGNPEEPGRLDRDGTVLFESDPWEISGKALVALSLTPVRHSSMIGRELDPIDDDDKGVRTSGSWIASARGGFANVEDPSRARPGGRVMKKELFNELTESIQQLGKIRRRE